MEKLFWFRQKKTLNPESQPGKLQTQEESLNADFTGICYQIIQGKGLQKKFFGWTMIWECT